MSRFTVRKAVVGVALLTGATLTMATASAYSISKAPKQSRRQLARACAANGGGSYGGSCAWGCTKNHDDGSADTIECTRHGLQATTTTTPPGSCPPAAASRCSGLLA